MRHTIYILLVFLSLLNAGCSSTLPSVKPYKVDVQQGNVVTYKMMQQLKPGMTKSQVRFVMGSPLIQDSFHTNRWDYFYQMRKDGQVFEQRRVILSFKDDLLADIGGDAVTEAAVDPISTSKSALIEPRSRESFVDRLQFWKEDKTIQPVQGAVSEVKPAEKEEGLLDKLKFWKSDDKPVDKVSKLTPAKAEPAKQEPASAEPEKAEESKSILAVAPSADVPSVLAVPLAVAAAEPSAPTARSPESVAQPEADKPQPVEEDKPAPAVAEHSTVADAPAEAPSLAPLDNSPIEMSLKLDRNLRSPASRMSPRILTPLNGLPVNLRFERNVDMAMFKANPATDAATEGPSDPGPGYFERMLEKIGF